MLNKLILTLFISLCSFNGFAIQSSLNGFASNVYTEQPLKNVRVDHNKINYKIESNTESVLPIIKTHVEVSLTNTSDTPAHVTLGLPIWHAEGALSQEEKISRDLHLRVTADEQAIKVNTNTVTEKESAWLAKLHTWQVTIPAHKTTVVNVHYDLAFSAESITANEANSTVIGKSGFYNHNTQSYGHQLSEMITVHCDLQGLKDYISNNSKVQAFLGRENKQKDPLRTVEVQNFPNYSKDHWVYAWEDHNKQYGFSFDIYNLPTNFADFKKYYADYKHSHTTAQLAVWDAMLQKIYTHAYEDVINDNKELAKIVNFLHR